MKKYNFFIILVIFLLLLSLSISSGIAQPVRFRQIDKNKDGVIDKHEWRMERQKEIRQRSRVNTWWEKRADTNNDGIVDSNELNAWNKLIKERLDLNNDGIIDAKERRLCWRHARSRVNTALEKKYDKNKDGWLEPEEVKELLRDRYILIKTEGKAKVDSAIEAEYDENEDGIIDPKEAKNINEDIQS